MWRVGIVAGIAGSGCAARRVAPRRYCLIAPREVEKSQAARHDDNNGQRDKQHRPTTTSFLWTRYLRPIRL